MKPRLLDLFCGAGGAGYGYSLAGFEVVGVDIAPQPHYPFAFWHMDALEVLATPHLLERFDAFHASPPCQGYSRMRHLPWLKDRVYPLLIDPVRELLAATGKPYAIENVEDSPLERRSSLFGTHGVLLCGRMFDLPLYRHRPFETSFSCPQPEHPRHDQTISPGRLLGDRGRVSSWERSSRMPELMGCPWMTQKEVGQAIPPAFTEFIGTRMLSSLDFAASVPSPEARK